MMPVMRILPPRICSPPLPVSLRPLCALPSGGDRDLQRVGIDDAQLRLAVLYRRHRAQPVTCRPSPSSVPLARVSATDERSARRQADIHMAVARRARGDVLHQPLPRMSPIPSGQSRGRSANSHLVEIKRQCRVKMIWLALHRALRCKMRQRPAVVAAQRHLQAADRQCIRRCGCHKRRVTIGTSPLADAHRPGAGAADQPHLAQHQPRSPDRTRHPRRPAHPMPQGTPATAPPGQRARRHRRQPRAQMGLGGASRQRRRQRQLRAFCPPSASEISAVPSAPPLRQARQVESPPAAPAMLTPSCRSTTITLASLIADHAQLTEQRTLARSRSRPAAAPVPPARRQPASPALACGWLTAVGRLRQAADIQAQRAIGCPHQGQPRAIDVNRTQRDAPQQQLAQRQRHLRAGYRHPPAAGPSVTVISVTRRSSGRSKPRRNPSHASATDPTDSRVGPPLPFTASSSRLASQGSSSGPCDSRHAEPRPLRRRSTASASARVASRCSSTARPTAA